MRTRITPVLLLAILTGCGNGSPPNPVKDALAATLPTLNAGTSVGFRLPGSGRNTRLYRLPTLDEVAWRFEAATESPSHMVGLASDEDIVYSLTAANELVALDLGSGRVRVLDTLVARAGIAPNGTVHLVRSDGSVAAVSRRVLTDWDHQFSAIPVSVHSAVSNRVVGIVATDSGTSVELLTEGQSPTAFSLPAGEVAVTPWGDLVAVATDSGLITLDPTGDTPAQWKSLRRAPVHVTFSPSGHRLYVTDSEGVLTVIERFELVVIDTLRLPEPPNALRIDPRGRVLLAAGAGDVVYLVDLVKLSVSGNLTSTWDEDLPAIAGDGTVLTRRGGAVVTLAMSLEERGRVESAPEDRWLIADWDPRRPGLELAAEAQEATPPPGQLIYVQVSSSHNPAWAEDFAANLRRAGMAATVLPPESEEELYRVVLGPHLSREGAEATAQKLGLPFWIFTQDTTTQDTTQVPR